MLSRLPLVGRGALRSGRERATYAALRTVHVAARAFRRGLEPATATRAVRAVRDLLDVDGAALYTSGTVLAATNGDTEHVTADAAADAIDTGKLRTTRRGNDEIVAVPIAVGDDVRAALAITRHGRRITLGLIRAAREVARQIALQLTLADGDRTRAELDEAKAEAARAQLSPHFIYNTLTTASRLVHSDPERARELLVLFAEYSRYMLRAGSGTATLADELRHLHTYLELERARHGPRLDVVFRIDPEVLNVNVPLLLLQPLVENAVRHGVETSEGTGVVRIVAEDRDDEVYLAVTDNGVGMSTEAIAALEAPTEPGDEHRSVGMRNVQARLAAAYGRQHRLLIDTKGSKGTTVAMRVPKYRATIGA